MKISLGLFVGLVLLPCEKPISPTAQATNDHPAIRTRVIVLCLDRSQREEVKELSLEPLTGEYSVGEGLGFSLHLALKEKGKFDCTSTGCLGVYGTRSGTWSLDGTGIKLITKSSKDRLKERPLEHLRVVSFQKHYLLVRDEDMERLNELRLRGWCFHKKAARAILDEEYTRRFKELVRMALDKTKADEKQATIPITEADTVLAVYAEDWTLWNTDIYRIIIAIWPDGHVVWSENRLGGGAPYCTGKVDPKKVAALVSQLEADGLFADEKLNDPHHGFDLPFTTIYVKSGKKVVRMNSDHEWFEASGKHVGKKGGTGMLGDRRRLDVLREERADYLFYRLVWSETRSKLNELIPGESQPSAGRLVKNEKGISWQEAPPSSEPAPIKK